MRQLSGHAAGFLYTDTAHSNANVSLIHIHDQRTAPGGVVRFKSVLSHIERRLHGAPVFRQRLQRVPMGLDHPYWVDDPFFDLEYHVRHIALPKPGDWRQFCIQVSRIHARPLDLDRPLWEAYVIEGLDSFLDLPGGSFALLLKTHLAAVDLVDLSSLTNLLYDAQAVPPPPGPPVPWFADALPGSLALVGRGLVKSTTAPLRLAVPLARVATHVAPAAVALASEMLLRPENLPVTRFNSVVSPHRVFETRRFTEAEFEAIRALVPGATVEDAVLAVCGGALRQYLDTEDELPDGHSLAAIIPAGTPAVDDQQVTWRHVQLGTDLADPLQRLKAIHAQTAAAPDVVSRTLGAKVLSEAAEQASAALLAWSRRWAGRAGARLGSRTPPANCSITMVPAPQQAMYLCGARLTYYSAILPISDGLGLAFAVTRYDGRVVISPTSCRELVPDPERFAQCVRDSFQAYLALATAPRPPVRPSTAPPKPRGAAAKRVRAAPPRGSSAGTARRPRQTG
jgi:diacylglycerol O-acyltransferase / wax synthase